MVRIMAARYEIRRHLSRREPRSRVRLGNFEPNDIEIAAALRDAVAVSVG
jgi:hypothetical protein